MIENAIKKRICVFYGMKWNWFMLHSNWMELFWWLTWNSSNFSGTGQREQRRNSAEIFVESSNVENPHTSLSLDKVKLEKSEKAEAIGNIDIPLEISISYLRSNW